jgi:hypothetical protein
LMSSRSRDRRDDSNRRDDRDRRDRDRRDDRDRDRRRRSRSRERRKSPSRSPSPADPSKPRKPRVTYFDILPPELGGPPLKNTFTMFLEARKEAAAVVFAQAAGEQLTAACSAGPSAGRHAVDASAGRAEAPLLTQLE